MNTRVYNALRKVAYGPGGGVDERKQERKLKRLREILSAEQMDKYRKYDIGSTGKDVVRRALQGITGALAAGGAAAAALNRFKPEFAESSKLSSLFKPAVIGNIAFAGLMGGIGLGKLYDSYKYSKGRSSASMTRDVKQALLDRIDKLNYFDRWSPTTKGELDALISANTPIYYDTERTVSAGV